MEIKQTFRVTVHSDGGIAVYFQNRLLKGEEKDLALSIIAAGIDNYKDWKKKQ